MNLKDCTLCPRECHVNRTSGQLGYCRMPAAVMAARAALHMWEEPCLSGKKGSGAVFFSGCTLRCIFCQNHEIADGNCGKEISVSRLSEIFLELQGKGAANINLVTAGHFLPQVIQALELAKNRGLTLPIVYNSSGYERVESIRTLAPYVDVWLPDFKYMDSELAKNLSHAADYPSIAKAALQEMVALSKPAVFDEEGYMQSGVIVRHLILPGHTKDSKAVLKYLHDTYGDKILISIMNQYTPLEQVKDMPPLNRRVTKREYQRVLDYAWEIGIEQGFFQDGETAKESFIPMFDYEGI